jgi:hypothetical protein
MAVVFMFTSLTLGYFAGKRTNRTIFDRKPVTTSRPAPPAVPVPAPAGQGGTQTGNPATPQAPAGTGTK